MRRQQLIIFEGIASSGKTTLERMLQERLDGSVIISEGQTLMPLIDNKDPSKAVQVLFAVLDSIKNHPAEIFIIDRFHLTHAFRTGTPLSCFVEIENRLRKKFNVLVVFLQMDEEVISDRIKQTAEFRGSSWVQGKQGTDEEKVAYYKNQQRVLAELMQQSKLPVCCMNTTNKNWSQYLKEILNSEQLSLFKAEKV